MARRGLTENPVFKTLLANGLPVVVVDATPDAARQDCNICSVQAA